VIVEWLGETNVYGAVCVVLPVVCGHINGLEIVEITVVIHGKIYFYQNYLRKN